MESDADADAGTGPSSPALGGGDAYAASYEAINASLASWTEADGGTGGAAARDVRMSLGGIGIGGRLSAGTRPSFATAHTSPSDDDDDDDEMDFDVFEEDGDDDEEEGGDGGAMEEDDDDDQDYMHDEPAEDLDLTGGEDDEAAEADGSFRSPLSVPFRTPLGSGGGGRRRGGAGGPVQTPGTAFRAGAPVDTPAATHEQHEEEAGGSIDDEYDGGESGRSGSAGADAGDYYGYGADGPYRPYHDALLRYLKARTTHNARSDLLDREAELDREEEEMGESEAIAQERGQLSDEMTKSELDLLLALSGAASCRQSMPASLDDDASASSSSTDVAGNSSLKTKKSSTNASNASKNAPEEARNESNVWLLLQSLRTLGLGGLLYDSSPAAADEQRAAAARRIYAVARGGVDATPPRSSTST